MNSSVLIKKDEQRIRPDKSEVLRLWADNKKAHKLCGWIPKHGGLEGFRQGLAKTIAWYKKYGIENNKSEIYNI